MANDQLGTAELGLLKYGPWCAYGGANRSLDRPDDPSRRSRSIQPQRPSAT